MSKVGVAENVNGKLCVKTEQFSLYATNLCPRRQACYPYASTTAKFSNLSLRLLGYYRRLPWDILSSRLTQQKSKFRSPKDSRCSSDRCGAEHLVPFRTEGDSQCSFERQRSHRPLLLGPAIWSSHRPVQDDGGAQQPEGCLHQGQLRP